MITNRTDLDACLRWMRNNGFTRGEQESWQRQAPYGGFDIVSNGKASQWTIWSQPPMPPPAGFYLDVIVAPWVAEEILAIGQRQSDLFVKG